MAKPLFVVFRPLAECFVHFIGWHGTFLPSSSTYLTSVSRCRSPERAPLGIDMCGALIVGSWGLMRITVACSFRPIRSDNDRIVGIALPAPISITAIRLLELFCRNRSKAMF
jgi:hypothetical protein